MEILNYGSYAKAISKGMARKNMTQIAKVLFEFIIQNGDVVDRNGNSYLITSKQASSWYKQEEPIPQVLVDATKLPNVVCEADTYFENEVLEHLIIPQKEANTYKEIIALVDGDDSIPQETKNDFIELHESDNQGAFLARVFMYAIACPCDSSKVFKSEAVSNISEDVNMLIEMLQKLPKPVELLPPDNLAEHEMCYVNELMRAYASAAGVECLVKEDLDDYDTYRENFMRQRKDYYLAESIRESARDSLSELKTDEFQVLKEETYDGIYEVVHDDYDNGYKKLNGVMKHVTTVKLSKSLLTRLPGWIGAGEKKGMCHMLVNDKVFRWVDDE
jgi:hypothetical protein